MARRADRDFQVSASARIRDFEGETPLQVLARQGGHEPTSMSSLERFPYYTAFPFAWYVAEHADRLAPGQVRPTRLLARDLVLWRADDGTPHVMDAYCPHLGANLAIGGRVNGDHLVCPYHWWEWDGEGVNVHIPYSDRTNRRARVRRYPTIERNGFILFWYHPDPDQEPLWEIPELAEYFTEEWLDLDAVDWVVRCPWQELAENGPDFVHLKTVHGAATVPEVEELRLEGYFNHLRSRVDFATPRGPQPGRIDTDGYGPGFSVARFAGIIDTVFLGATTPIDWERTWSIKAYKVRVLGEDAEALARTERVGAALVADLHKQMAEDNVIFDNKIHVSDPSLAAADGPILEYRRWAQQFYVVGDPVAAGRVRSEGGVTSTVGLSRKQAATRTRLMDAAAGLAAAASLDFTMRDVADAAEVSVATAYTYFGSREHLLAETYADWVEELTGRLGERPPRNTSTVARLQAMLRRATEGLAESPELARAFTLAMASADPAVMAIQPRVHATFRTWLDSALGDEPLRDRDALVATLELTMFGAMITHAHGTTTVAELRRSLQDAARLLLEGARP